MLVVQNISKTFHAGTQSVGALRSVSFEVKKGEICGLAGPNGAGKTTLLRILTTQLLADEGEASVAGWDLRRDPVRVKRSLGYAPGDGSGFYPRLTASQNLRFFGALFGLEDRAVQKKLDELGAVLNLQNFWNTPLQQLSSGAVQSLVLARALLTDAPVLLFDELSRSLDKETAARFWKFLKEIHSGKTMLVVSHNEGELTGLCHRVLKLEGGSLR